MNINDDYQKRRGQKTSSTEGIIEPNKKYLESNSFYPLSNFNRETLKRYRKINRSSKFG